jgi:hypothetical protein
MKMGGARRFFRGLVFLPKLVLVLPLYLLWPLRMMLRRWAR